MFSVRNVLFKLGLLSPFVLLGTLPVQLAKPLYASVPLLFFVIFGISCQVVCVG